MTRKNHPYDTAARPEVADLVRRARSRSGVSQRDLAERAGVGLRTLREIEQGRVRTPRPGSLRRLAKALQEPALLVPAGGAPDDGQPARFQENDPLVLRALGRFRASRGHAELATGTPKQQQLLALMAIHPNEVVERDAIVHVLWDRDLPDSFGQSIHTYVSRIRLLLEAHRAPGAGKLAIVRRSTGYELRVDDAGQLDLLEFGRLTKLAARAQAGNDLVAEQVLLSDALKLWQGPLLEGMSPALRGHPVAVEQSRQRVRAALRFADLALSRGQYEAVLTRLGPIARHEVLHEALHARLITALAGSGRRTEALELYASIDRCLREESGIGPGDELRHAHMAVLHDDAGPRTAPSVRGGTGGGGLPQPRLPQPAGDFVGREEHFQIRQYLTGQGPGVVLGASPIAALYGPAGVGKSHLAGQLAAGLGSRFPDGVLHARIRTGAAEETRDLLHGFLRALGVAAVELPGSPAEATRLYRRLVAGRRVLVVVDGAVSERSVRPLLPSGPGGAVLLTSRLPLSGLEGARHFRIGPFTTDQSVLLLARVAGESRVLSERAAAETIAELCGGVPLAVRIAGMRLAARPHWSPAHLAHRLADEDRRLDELVVGDLAMRDRLRSAHAGLGPALREAEAVLARHTGRALTVGQAAVALRCGTRQAEDVLEQLVDHQVLEPPQGPGGAYVLPPLVRLHAREQATT